MILKSQVGPISQYSRFWTSAELSIKSTEPSQMKKQAKPYIVSAPITPLVENTFYIKKGVYYNNDLT